jgi:putative ABC transport system substrate-binding protein
MIGFLILLLHVLISPFKTQARQGGEFVGKVLAGAKAADLPVERPSRILLAVNMKTAAALGVTIPQVILLRADQVIE